LDTFLLPNYDVSPDGQRIVAASPIEHESAAPLTLVQSWTALLKKFPRGTHLACQRSFNNSNAYECPSAAETFWLWRTVKGPGGFFRF
jgi:hypothetical protein